MPYLTDLVQEIADETHSGLFVLSNTESYIPWLKHLQTKRMEQQNRSLSFVRFQCSQLVFGGNDWRLSGRSKKLYLSLDAFGSSGISRTVSYSRLSLAKYVRHVH